MEVAGEAQPFRLFSNKRTKLKPKPKPEPEVQTLPEAQIPNPAATAVETDNGDPEPAPTAVTKTTHSDDSAVEDGHGESNPGSTIVTETSQSDDALPSTATFADLGLSQWLVDSCDALGMRRPTAVQRRCIPRALAGEDVLGIAETGSGKTAAFALPILHRLGEDPYGVAALALAPTRELAAQLAEQFRALGAQLGLRCLAAIGGFDSLAQAKGLARRPTLLSPPLDESPRSSKTTPTLPKYSPVPRTCYFLDVLLEELGCPAVSLHSYKSQPQRLSALSRFKSGQVPVLISTDVGSRGLDIPTVDLVINYDIPRFPRDYIHRVGRTARASRGGLSISFVTQKDICLLHEIEDVVGKQLDAYECNDREVTKDITKVFKAKRLAKMRADDEGLQEKVQARREQKKRDLARKRKHGE
ncbi:hypothetical protein PR202_gb21780 [Eleusine coracana subsp. coracana]|uniref:Uncharacterized protein n=1 Tax=Eleusine coracana subsp. coracana TaxID=191504 RepID=A0AAV5FE17_ELECO|nr:hypothetical protein PR202_gb21780 [Eleusine coracana subsp. coracana]